MGSGEQSEYCSSALAPVFVLRVSSVSCLFWQSRGISCTMLPTSLPVFLLLGSASLIDARFLLFSSQPSKCPSTAHCTPLSRCPGMSALVKDSTRHGGINLLRRSSCGFARSEPMVCCSSESKVKEEEKVGARVVNVIQRAGGSLSGRVDDSNVLSFGGPASRPSDNVAERKSDKGSSAVRFGGSSGSEEVAQMETGRKIEEEFSRRDGFGPEVSVEDAGEDWGGEDEDGEEDDEWREVAEGESWDLGGGGDLDESYEGEDWGLESLGTKCVTAFDCV